MRHAAPGADHVWSYDFVSGFTHDCMMVRMLKLIDEFMQECLAIFLRRHLNSANVIKVPADAVRQLNQL